MDPNNLLFGGTALLTTVIVCISILFTLVITGVAIAVPFYMMRNSQKRAQALIQKGTQGEATILSLADTGMRINDNPRVTVELEVRMPNMPPYRVKKTVTIELIRLPQVQVGSVMPVLVDMSDPQNPDKVGLLMK